ncbi:GNAT family N-acetyltransferase [Schaalia suimastitidis]|uniref:GNAT family N-acetyltransferase n=1 Tax=Schaalia suimastitidis TaxID=121163 RepID=UPI0003FF2637|nr:GNAT family N-acetyltransferase [Schaalia suimastitidis]
MTLRYTCVNHEAAHLISTWVTSPQETTLFAGTTLTYPFTAEDFLDPTDLQWVALAFWDDTQDDNQLVATASYRKLDNETVRVGRILVNPTMRGRGYGRAVVQILVTIARQLPWARHINLGVFDNNPVAHHVYESCGFRDCQTFSVTVHDSREVWTGVRMTMPLT